MTVTLFYENVTKKGKILGNFLSNQDIRKYSKMLSKNKIPPVGVGSPQFYRFLDANKFNYNISNKIDYVETTPGKSFAPFEFFNQNDNLKIDIANSQLYKYLDNGELELLVWWAHEGYMDKPDILDNLHQLFPNTKIRFIYGNKNTKPDWATERQEWLTIRSIDYWFFHTQHHNKNSYRKLTKDKVATKDFSFYNRYFRFHRALTFYELYSEGLLDNADVSYIALNRENLSNHYASKVFFESAQLLDMDISSLDPKFIAWLDSNFTCGNCNNVNFYQSTLCSKSYLDLVSETSISADVNNKFITEKTYRSIAFGNLFLIIGEPFTLKTLKEKGFVTFDNVFDESYDTEINFFKRWKIIKDNITWWVSLGQEGQRKIFLENFDKIVYNREILLNKKPNDDIERIFL